MTLIRKIKSYHGEQRHGEKLTLPLINADERGSSPSSALFRVICGTV
jgi:hypothetical protein